jgi:hypothetical protein
MNFVGACLQVTDGFRFLLWRHTVGIVVDTTVGILGFERCVAEVRLG